MPRHKKKFIDKKNAVTFHLVHRSQQDPMLVSENSQHVLLPTPKNTKEKQLEMQRQFGIYFDDDYNYLQHLKETDETCVLEEVETFQVNSTQAVKTTPDQKLVLPSTVFASAVETNVGLLNKAAPNSGPKIDWDPEIVAALDGDFDYDDPDGTLEDDFFIKANEHLEGEEATESESESDCSSDVGSDVAERSDEELDEYYMEETKSHFTDYSMSSSVVTRSEALMDLDDQFEKFFEQYDDSEIGALDFDHIDGNVDETCERMNKLIKAYQESKAEGKMDDILKTVSIKASDMGDLSSSDEEVIEVEAEEEGEKWDCESILSTYSNLYNHPKLIVEDKKPRKIKLNHMGFPSEAFSQPKGLVKKDLEAAMNTSVISNVSQRDKNETKTEKKNRKFAVKEQKRERRIEKKLNQNAFKEAHLKEQRDFAHIHRNLKSVAIS